MMAQERSYRKEKTFPDSLKASSGKNLPGLFIFFSTEQSFQSCIAHCLPSPSAKRRMSGWVSQMNSHLIHPVLIPPHLCGSNQSKPLRLSSSHSNEAEKEDGKALFLSHFVSPDIFLKKRDSSSSHFTQTNPLS